MEVCLPRPVRLASVTFCKEIEQVSLSSLGTARGLWLLSDMSSWTAQGLQPVGEMYAVLTLVADGVQFGEQQQAKI